MLFNREAALAWTRSEKGLISSQIKPPHVVRTISHTLWKAKPYRLPQKLLPIEPEMVNEREQLGLIERSWGPYQNISFFVPKKIGRFPFIISCISANKVTLASEYAGLPPNVEEFAVSFAGYPLVTLLDFYAGYEQVVSQLNPATF